MARLAVLQQVLSEALAQPQLAVGAVVARAVAVACLAQAQQVVRVRQVARAGAAVQAAVRLAV